MLTLFNYHTCWQAGFRRVIDAGRQKAFGRVCCWLESQWHVCSWAQQSASRGHAWVSWATPYASEMAALIVNDACCCSSGWPLSNIRLPQRSLHQSCSLTSSTPTMVQAAQLYHCIHHFVASTVGCAQRWQNYAFSSSVFHSSIGIDCIASLIDCDVLLHLAMDGEGSMWFLLSLCVASLVRVWACGFHTSGGNWAQDSSEAKRCSA